MVASPFNKIEVYQNKSWVDTEKVRKKYLKRVWVKVKIHRSETSACIELVQCCMRFVVALIYTASLLFPTHFYCGVLKLLGAFLDSFLEPQALPKTFVLFTFPFTIFVETSLSSSLIKVVVTWWKCTFRFVVRFLSPLHHKKPRTIVNQAGINASGLTRHSPAFSEPPQNSLRRKANIAKNKLCSEFLIVLFHSSSSWR